MRKVYGPVVKVKMTDAFETHIRNHAMIILGHDDFPACISGLIDTTFFARPDNVTVDNSKAYWKSIRVTHEAFAALSKLNVSAGKGVQYMFNYDITNKVSKRDGKKVGRNRNVSIPEREFMMLSEMGAGDPVQGLKLVLDTWHL